MKKKSNGCLFLTIFLIYLIILVVAINVQGQVILTGDYVKNYDGDTFTFMYQAPSDDQHVEYEEKLIKVRLYNVDTYEMRDSENRELACEAKDLTAKELMRGKVMIELLYKDSYSRWVAKVYPEGRRERLGELLKRKGLTTGKYENKRLERITIKRYTKYHRKY